MVCYSPHLQGMLLGLGACSHLAENTRKRNPFSLRPRIPSSGHPFWSRKAPLRKGSAEAPRFTDRFHTEARGGAATDMSRQVAAQDDESWWAGVKPTAAAKGVKGWSNFREVDSLVLAASRSQLNPKFLALSGNGKSGPLYRELWILCRQLAPAFFDGHKEELEWSDVKHKLTERCVKSLGEEITFLGSQL